MRLVFLAAVALTASAGVAFAGQSVDVAAKTERGMRQVTVCDRSADARGSWIRDCAGLSASSGVASVRAERPTRQVFVCNRSSETRRSWIREYGAITFITADELAKAESSNENWSTPRCMTSAEMQRFAKGRPEAVTVARAINAAPSQ